MEEEYKLLLWWIASHCQNHVRYNEQTKEWDWDHNGIVWYQAYDSAKTSNGAIIAMCRKAKEWAKSDIHKFQKQEAEVEILKLRAKVADLELRLAREGVK